MSAAVEPENSAFVKTSTVLADALQKRFADTLIDCTIAHGEVTIVIEKTALHEVCIALRDEKPFLFEQLIDLCGVDYSLYGQSEWDVDNASSSGFGRGAERSLPEGSVNAAEDMAGKRFAVVYHLLSVTCNQRLRIRTFVDDLEPIVASITHLWACADWFEREAFDLFGILFEGHDDLRRILTDYGFIGYPFRKDFPLSGHIAMRYDAEKRRVVYEPVEIEPRMQIPRVVRNDNRYQKFSDKDV